MLWLTLLVVILTALAVSGYADHVAERHGEELSALNHEQAARDTRKHDELEAEADRVHDYLWNLSRNR